jgi:hypothetical protein
VLIDRLDDYLIGPVCESSRERADPDAGTVRGELWMTISDGSQVLARRTVYDLLRASRVGALWQLTEFVEIVGNVASSHTS